MSNNAFPKLPGGQVAFAVALVDPVSGKYLPDVADPYGAVRIIDAARWTVHAGQAFEVGASTIIGTGQSAYFLGVTGDIDTHLHSFAVMADGAPLQIEFFEGVTTSANGTLLSARNRNRILDTAALTVPYAGPTVTNDGIRLAILKLYGTQKSTGSNELNSEWMLKRNTKYAFKLTNQSAQSIDVTAGFSWVEQNSSV